MKVKCPWCGDPAEDLIDSAELLELIEKAEITSIEVNAASGLMAYPSSREIYDAIKSYLSGDRSALKALAGVKE